MIKYIWFLLILNILLLKIQSKKLYTITYRKSSKKRGSMKNKKQFNQPLLRKVITSVSILLALAVLTALAIFVFLPVINFLGENKTDELKEYFNSFGWFGRFVFIGLAAFQVVLAIVPGGPVQIAAGSVYGAVQGSILSLIGIEIGSIIAFLLVKKFGFRVVGVFFSPEKSEKFRFLLNDKLTQKRLNSITWGLFFIPGSPKDLLSYLSGLTPMKLKTFILISTIARAPFIIISALGGASMINNSFWVTAIIFSIITVVCIVSILLYKNYFTKHLMRKIKKDNDHNDDKAE